MQIRSYLHPCLIVLAYAAAYAALTAMPGTAVWRPAAGLDLAWPVLFGLAYLPLVPLATLAEGLYHGMPAAASFLAEGMARFAAAENVEVANQFMDFVLRPEVQAEIAVRNVQFPATTTAELPEEFAKYAQEPEEAVTFTYEELKGNLSEWTDAWARQFASK